MHNLLTMFILILASCFSSSISVAQSTNVPKRPLVFIPGIIGSQLWKGDTQLWGSLSGIRNLGELVIPNGLRPIDSSPTCSPAELADEKLRDNYGIIEDFVILPPFKLNQYGNLLAFLQSTLGYVRNVDNKNLFVFPYDWRRSNFDTAKDFKTFVNSHKALARHDFDILAHSMGGLIALIYTTLYDSPDTGKSCEEQLDRCKVQSVISMGTPFYGSMSAVATADTGWGAAFNWIPGGQQNITKTILTWPSLYELLLKIELEKEDGGGRVDAQINKVGANLQPIVLKVGSEGKVIVDMDVDTIARVLPPKGDVEVSINGRSVFKGPLKNVQPLSGDALLTSFRFETEPFSVPIEGAVLSIVRFPGMPPFQSETASFKSD